MGVGGENLDDSEQRYETVVAAMAEGVVLQDASFTILACNEAAERILGLTRDQMTGRTSLDARWRAIHEDGSPFPGETHPVPVTLTTGHPQRDVVMGVHKPDDTLSWISINSQPLFRPGESKPYAAVCTFSDITQSKETERALAVSEERYRRIVEASFDGIVICDLDTLEFVLVNQRMADILGTTTEEIRSRSFWDWFEPEDAEIVRRKLADRAIGVSETYDLKYRRLDGTHAYCSVAGSSLEDPDGRRLVMAMVRDETAARRTAMELAETQARIQQAFALARMGWFEDDFTVGRAVVSPELVEIAGWPADQTVSHDVFDSLIHPDDREAQRAAFARMLASDGARHAAGEFRIVRPDGSIRWVSVNARIVADPPTGRPRAMGVVMDVTERRILEDQLLESRKLEGIGRLAGGVAHDFNNLLTAILASVDLADRQRCADPSEHLATIRTAAERAAGLTRQLLAFARKQVIDLRTVDLNHVVRDLDPVLRSLVGEHIEVVSRLAHDLWPVRADQGKLGQVLVNLVANARDAMPGGGKVTIETSNVILGEGDVPSRPELGPGAFAVLAVADTGAGIDPAASAHMFEPFFTTKPSGTGLGLPSVYGTVKQLGGYVRASSEVGRGATFEVYLPRAPAPEADERADQPDPRAAGSAHETVLLVEDDEILRRVIAAGLTEIGYRVLTTSNGQEAVELLGRYQGPVDLVVTDLVMPKMSGRILAGHLRAARPGLRILMMSGYSEDMVAGGDDVGAEVEFLPKPFTIDTLNHRMRELLDRRG